MTKKELDSIREQQAAAVARLERKHLKKVLKAVHAQFLRFQKAFIQYGEDAARRDLDKLVANEDLFNALYDLYSETALLQANRTLRDINRSARRLTEEKGFGYNEEWINAIISYLKENLLVKAVVPVTDTTRLMILKILRQAQDQGWGADETARMFANEKLSLARAKLITRTEMVQAANFGDKLAESKSKWELDKTWVSAHDPRTRHSHRLVDGDTIPAQAKFKVPIFRRVGKVDVQIGDDYMTGPGDPGATIGNLANCRCRAVYRARRDENGRLVPKTQTSLIIQ